MTKRKLISILVVLLLACIIGGGSFYYYASHHVEKMISGHAYQYSSKLNGKDNNRTMYVTFSENSDKAIVTQDKSEALKATRSSGQFEQVYKEQSKNASWKYKASDNKLTLGKVEGNQLSQWQYNNVLAFGKHFSSSNFTYQIAKAGQGQVKQKMIFKQID
ncbi:hypothetical protein ACFSN5_02480 [Streptococcus tangpeifui]|uniref:hypothetical protein n=1 Tax=Streptococcus tangpeifui TaxID=2709400 RepID=UPI0013EA12EE|nr:MULTISPECIES: hypothetical protein [unclassified Streptococcus]